MSLAPERRRALRQRVSARLLAKLHQYLLEVQPEVLPKSTSGAAVRDTLNQWEALTRFLEGDLEIDNRMIQFNGDLLPGIVSWRADLPDSDRTRFVPLCLGLQRNREAAGKGRSQRIRYSRRISRLFEVLPVVGATSSARRSRLPPPAHPVSTYPTGLSITASDGRTPSEYMREHIS
ncbi:MAG: transposase [Acidobacteriaceae bacterium]|nr:transposase [Acidobacteriaceae bacterium]